MRTVRLRPEDLPQTSKLYRDYLNQFPRTKAFYAHPPAMGSVRSRTREIQLSAANRQEIAEILRRQNSRFGADASVVRSLDRLAAGAGAVVTGQQVGLFGGPAYCVYKALTAAKLADDLTKQGVESVPVFWLASEDHDLAEVNHTDWLTRSAELLPLAIPANPSTEGRPVGDIQLGSGISLLLESVTAALDGPGAEDIAAILRDACAPNDTYSSSFAKLMARLLAGRGIILLDPLDARIHQLAAPLFERAVFHAPELTAALLARGKALEKSGYHAQVKVAERGTALFLIHEGVRVPLRLKNSGFVADNSSFSPEELVHIARNNPELLSANALLRPVMQDAILPTLASIVGPAECAYYAQSSVLYVKLSVSMPVILPRAGFSLVEPHVARLLKKYDLGMADVFSGRQTVRRKLEQAFLPAALERSFTASEKAFRAQLKKFRGPLAKLDKTLLGARDTAERKILYQFEKLRAKAGRARDFRTGVLSRHESIMLNSLWPHHGLQERALNLLPFLSRAGTGLLDELQSRATPSGEHHILYL